MSDEDLRRAILAALIKHDNRGLASAGRVVARGAEHADERGAIIRSESESERSAAEFIVSRARDEGREGATVRDV